MPSRLPDWQSQLQTAIAERWTVPFQLGQQDCFLFVADCVQAMTGHDIAAAVRGKYENEVGVARILVKAGGFEALLASVLGDSISPGMAQVGDVGMHLVDGSPAAAVCAGTRWLAAGPDGVMPVPDGGILAAWRCC